MKPRIVHVAEMDDPDRAAPRLLTRADAVRMIKEARAIDRMDQLRRRRDLLLVRLRMLSSFFIVLGAGVLAAALFGGR